MSVANPFEHSLDEYHPARDRLHRSPLKIGDCDVIEFADPELRVHRGLREWWVTLKPVDPDDRRRWQFSLTTRQTIYVGPHDGKL